jgi:hypothetical protein
VLERRSCPFSLTVNEDAEFSSARLLGVDFWGFRESVKEDARCPRTVVAILSDDEKTLLREINNVFFACEQRVKTRDRFGHHMSSVCSCNTSKHTHLKIRIN